MAGGRKVKIAVIGAGQRGMVYAGYMADNYNEEIVAVVKPHEIRRSIAKEKFDIPSENVFKDSDDFFAKGKLADVVIIASMDRDHYGQVMKALKEGPYGRCVYRCDNNVCDHQVSIIEFENGVTATFHLSGFTNKIHRTIKVMCEDGDIYGDDVDDTIIVTKYASNGRYESESRKFNTDAGEGGHGGGDFGIVKDFIEGLRFGSADSRSSIDRSVESHIMAYAAEKSRVENKVVIIKDLKKELMTNES